MASATVDTSVPEIKPAKEHKYVIDARDYIPFGSDNLFPQAVAALNRKSAVNRGILKSKKTYTIGKKITADESNKKLLDFIDEADAFGNNLRTILRPIIGDGYDFGNSYMEIVTNAKRTFLNVYHRDATECRVSTKKGYIIIHPDWSRYQSSKEDAVTIPIYPNFEPDENGNLHSIYHFKEYEPEFKHYGVMDWIAGIGIGAIAYKTDKWNISRLDNSFKSSGILIVDGDFDDETEAEELKEEFKDEFTGEGNTGKVMFIAKQLGGDGTKFVSIKQDEEGDWTKLHKQSSDDLIVAHNWYRTLSGLPTSTGFDTDVILNEYKVALSTTITDRQEFYKDVIEKILWEQMGIDASDLHFVNEPPIKEKPAYMRIWEARKLDGLDYDENDPLQQKYLAELGTKNKTNE